ncbi:sensor histidine kinase [Candidatus Poriferisodalis sp.]|uniref:sensor histidine kinase n=1 Tax=Candidatus Poriferisodalis sp. TaxID=3101277 RepID=UPI003B0259BE
MRRPRLGSVQVRTTLAATAATALVLVTASIVIVQLVERNLANNARTALGDALESASHAASGEGSSQSDAALDAEDGAAHDDGAPIAEQDADGSAGDSEQASSSDLRNEQLAEASIQEVRDGVDAVADALKIIVPVVVLLLGAAIWITVGRTLRPVRDISRHVAAISGSTLDERVPEPSGDDEIAELAGLMNEMLDRLESASERQRAFVADASHELKSPLATIVAVSEIAQISSDPQRLAELAPKIETEARRMQGLAADLLDLARLDVQRDDRDFSTVDLSAVCRAVASRLDDADIDIAVSSNGPALALGTGTQIERAVFNVVENAVCHAASRVQITTMSSADAVRAVVEDDGAGIAAADRERVFDRFVRLDESRQRDSGGAGIGLSLVKAIVDRHSGTVEIGESTALGGAAVVFELPSGAAVELDDPATAERTEP